MENENEFAREVLNIPDVCLIEAYGDEDCWILALDEDNQITVPHPPEKTAGDAEWIAYADTLKKYYKMLIDDAGDAKEVEA